MSKEIPKQIIKSCNECFYNGEDGCSQMEDSPEVPDDFTIPDWCPLDDAPEKSTLDITSLPEEKI